MQMEREDQRWRRIFRIVVTTKDTLSILCNLNHSVPGHVIAHGLLSMSAPSQPYPPSEGRGLSQARCLAWLPSPHVTLHTDQSDQSDHLPSTKESVCNTINEELNKWEAILDRYEQIKNFSVNFGCILLCIEIGPSAFQFYFTVRRAIFSLSISLEEEPSFRFSISLEEPVFHSKFHWKKSHLFILNFTGRRAFFSLSISMKEVPSFRVSISLEEPFFHFQFHRK